MQHQENPARLAALLERSATDGVFRQLLLADPRGTLEAEGVPIPPEIEVIVLENTASEVNLVIPAAPDQGDLEDAQLENMAGGGGSAIVFAPFPTSWISYTGPTGAIFDGGVSPGARITIGSLNQATRLK